MTGCDHITAQQRVFDQIDGRGVQPACTGGGSSLDTFAGTIGALGDLNYLINMTVTGRYQATLTWPDASIDLDLYLATVGCTTYPPTSCLLTTSRAVGVNREQISWPVRAGEQYRLWVDNFTGRSTSFTIEHFITTSDTRTPITLVPPLGPMTIGNAGVGTKTKR